MDRVVPLIEKTALQKERHQKAGEIAASVAHAAVRDYRTRCLFREHPHQTAEPMARSETEITGSLTQMQDEDENPSELRQM